MDESGIKADQSAQVIGSEVSDPAVSEIVAPAEQTSLREDQIQNAVAFLSHPKVKDSPVASKRSFLERKGLTAAEIDEAFARVPESSSLPSPPQTSFQPSNSATPPYSTSQLAAGQAPPKPFPQQATAVQPGAALALPGAGPQAPPLHVGPPPQQGLRWSQVVLGMGATAAAVIAVQQYVYPYFADKYRQLLAKSCAKAEAAEQREQLLLATIKELQANQKELQEHLQGFGGVLKSIQEDVGSVRHQAAVRPSSQHDNRPGGWDGPTNSWQSPGDFYSSHRDSGGLRSNWGSRYDQNVHGGAWQGGAANGASMTHSHKQTSREESSWRGAAAARSTSNAAPHEPTPHNPSYAEVVEMLQQGITPPNVRTDINDQPPDPTRPFSESRAPMYAKPWQRGPGSVSSDQDGPPSNPPRTPPFHSSPVYTHASAHAPAHPSSTPSLPTTYDNDTTNAGAFHPSAANPSTAGTLSTSAVHTTTSETSTSTFGRNVLAIESNPRDASRVNVPSSSAQLGREASGWSGKSDTPWRPPPPPAATVTMKAVSAVSTTVTEQVAPAGSGSALGSGTGEVEAAAASNGITEAVEDGVGSDV